MTGTPFPDLAFGARRGVDWQEAESLQEVAADVEVLYQTRIQKERFQDRPEDYEKARGKYIINKDIMEILPKDSVVMHPLPRVDEVRVLTTDHTCLTRNILLHCAHGFVMCCDSLYMSDPCQVR